MNVPLMPKATAVWLVENTTLSFDQIADFCGLHPLEVQGIADGDVATGLIGDNPVSSGQLKQEELEKALADENYRMKLGVEINAYITEQKKKKANYTPVARRQDKPDAIAWLLKHHPLLSDAQLVKLIGTTKKTIQSIRDRSYWNISNLQPRDPVLLGLCTQTDLHAAIEKLEKAKAREDKKSGKAPKEADSLEEPAQDKAAQS